MSVSEMEGMTLLEKEFFKRMDISNGSGRTKEEKTFSLGRLSLWVDQQKLRFKSLQKDEKGRKLKDGNGSVWFLVTVQQLQGTTTGDRGEGSRDLCVAKNKSGSLIYNTL